MNRIPMRHRGKRPRFFEAKGMDELMSMVLEVTTEVWVLKKRLYLLERVANNAGVSLTPEIENYDLSEAEITELDGLRAKLIATVLHATDSDFIPTHRVDESNEQANQNVEAA